MRKGNSANREMCYDGKKCILKIDKDGNSKMLLVYDVMYQQRENLGSKTFPLFLLMW